jgi:hypothetical protein
MAAGLVLAAGAARAQSGGVTFVSPEAALEQGIGAYRGGFYQHALPALQYAADKGLLLGKYHLAMLYADNASASTNHVKAYQLFLDIVEKNARSIHAVDDDERAPYVGKALTALARYFLRGIPEYNLQPNPERAAEFFSEADVFFRDPDARFELAKMFLKGEGVPENRRQALTRLTALVRDGHVGATAFFADLLWRGKSVEKDEVQALVLIRWAVENAPAHERIWIEDIYQSIYCGSGTGVRKKADEQVAGYSQSYTRRLPSEAEERMGLGIGPKRTCDNGEPVPLQPIRDGRAPSETRNPRTQGPAPASVPGSPPTLDIRGQPPRR